MAFIKIDTDGHEFTVLFGADSCLSRDRPVLLFEACEYLMRSPSWTFNDFVELLSPHGYSIRDSASHTPLDSDGFYRVCPVNRRIDFVAVRK